MNRHLPPSLVRQQKIREAQRRAAEQLRTGKPPAPAVPPAPRPR